MNLFVYESISARAFCKETTYSPRMKEHVESESPQFEAFVRAINEYAVGRHRTRRIHLTFSNCIIRKESQL